MTLVLPTHLAGSTIPRYNEHDQTIAALCRLRDKYPTGSPQYLALNANAETVNRLGGRCESSLIDKVEEQRRLIVEGYNACSWYMRDGDRHET